MKKFLVASVVYAEVEGVDSLDAIHALEIATGWPGDWSPPREPVTIKGTWGRHSAEAKLTRSVVLMTKEIDE